MSFLAAVQQGPIQVGIRAVIAGAEKMGKTTLLESTPRPLLIPLEQGFIVVNMPRLPVLDHFDQVMAFLDEAIAAAQAGQFPYQSLCFDNVTRLEALIHQKVLESDPTYGRGNKKALTMEAALGGYGKAYQYANELFGNFLQKCDWLSMYARINIFLVCHVFQAKILDPTAGEYDSWDLQLHSPKNQKTYGKREMITQWADLIGFLHEKLYVTDGDRMNKAVNAGTGRILGVTRTTGYVAGNRFGVTKEIPIPPTQGWNHVAQAIYEAKGLDYYTR